MASIDLPSEVEAVFREFRTSEFSTIARDGTPITWPTSPRYQAEQARFLVTVSIGLSQKAVNIRRNPHVALLYSNPTGSGLLSPPSVLVQGDAIAPDNVVTSLDGLEDYWRDTIFARQPASAAFSRNALTRKLMDWYYMRLLIFVSPRRILWWPAGDFSQPAHRLEVMHVG
jgi:hypothetical protein